MAAIQDILNEGPIRTEDLSHKAESLASLIKESKHFIIFTGAGISTAAGIPDFRGPNGVWTLRDQGREDEIRSVDTTEAIPTPTHMALVALQNQGILKYLISQNCDGLHRRSGILPDVIAELHGNNNLEYCSNCGYQYLRDFQVVATYERPLHDHQTGRTCTQCGGSLLDSIVNFNEPIPPLVLQRAEDHARKADLCLVLGSSLRVGPANEIPGTVGYRKGAQLVICNLEETPLDGSADLRVWAPVDDLMVHVMESLRLPIPPFILQKRLMIDLETDGHENHCIQLYGVDVDGTPASFLRSVHARMISQAAHFPGPFSFKFGGKLAADTNLTFELVFMGHYREPNLEIILEYDGEGDMERLYLLEYNPLIGQWKTSLEGEEI